MDEETRLNRGSDLWCVRLHVIWACFKWDFQCSGTEFWVLYESICRNESIQKTTGEKNDIRKMSKTRFLDSKALIKSELFFEVKKPESKKNNNILKSLDEFLNTSRLALCHFSTIITTILIETRLFVLTLIHNFAVSSGHWSREANCFRKTYFRSLPSVINVIRSSYELFSRVFEDINVNDCLYEVFSRAFSLAEMPNTGAEMPNTGSRSFQSFHHFDILHFILINLTNTSFISYITHWLIDLID